MSESEKDNTHKSDAPLSPERIDVEQVINALPLEAIQSAAGLCSSEARKWAGSHDKTAEHWESVARLLNALDICIHAWRDQLAALAAQTHAPLEAENEKDHSAELIHQPIPDVEGTEPRLNPEGAQWNAVEELERLLQAADGLKAGALTFPGMWHYADIARRALNALRVGNASVSANSGIAGTMSSAQEYASPNCAALSPSQKDQK